MINSTYFKMSLDAYSVNKECLIQYLEDNLEEVKHSLEFTLKKYTWDGKKTYEDTHRGLVEETRADLARVKYVLWQLSKGHIPTK